MPWNPGRSYYTPTVPGLIANGRFVRSTVAGRPVIRIWYTGKVPEPRTSASHERASWWLQGRGYRNVLPLVLGPQDGPLWGWFPVDEPSPGASPADILSDHNAGKERGPRTNEGLTAGWSKADLKHGSTQPSSHGMPHV
jgi:hypothetical protein